MNPRSIAAHTIAQVIIHKRSLTHAFSELPKDQRELGLIKMLCFGVLRWYLRLDHMASQLLSKPLKRKDADIQLLLLIGLFQIIYLKTPAHIAVSQTVEATRDLGKPWATQLINGVLRNFLRDNSAIEKKADASVCAYYSHPDWLIEKIRHAWPEQWQSILIANNQQPPLHLRVNRCKLTREAYLKLLHEQNFPAQPLAYCDTAISVTTPVDVYLLPGFATGLVSVQDCAAQLAAALLDLQPNQRILDACAAPGGKTTHIAETQPKLTEIVAIDSELSRLEKAKDNWQRSDLHTAITWIVARAEKIDTWWDGQLFDRILLDAPCSSTGVIRRHPDIKWLREASDIASLGMQQLSLLNALWSLLKPGGLLVYATCSLLPEENQLVIGQFLATHADAAESIITASWGKASPYGRQILPGHENMDGFYYARLQKDKA